MESTVNLPDEELIAQFKTGQLSRHEIIKTLFERYYHLLYVIALRSGLDQSSTEEIITDTFISLPDKMVAYKGKSSFKSYLNILFRYNLLKYKEHDKPIKSLKMATDPNSFDDFADQTNQGAQIDQHIANREISLAISNLLNSLPEIERAILILHVYEDASPQEIAEALGINRNKVHHRLHRARRKLREGLKDLSFNDMVSSYGK